MSNDCFRFQTIGLTLISDLMSKLSNREILGFHDWPLILIGTPILGFLIPIVFFGMPFEPNNLDFYLKWFKSAIYVIANWTLARYLIIFFRKRFPNERQIVKRISWISLLYFISSNLITGVCLTLLLNLIKLGTNASPTLLESNIATITIFITISSIYESIYFFKKWKLSIVQNEALKKEIMQAQINSLRAQVNPHFLFNSLNALTNLIHNDPDTAVKFTEKLSQTYRYILQMNNTELIHLKDELKFLQAYQYLNKVRYGESIHFDISIDEAAKKKLITPLALQMLVENAIKHNIVSKTAPLKIKIYNENGSIIVKNNYQIKKQNIVSTKTGLANIKRRYAFISDKEVDVIQTNDDYIVIVPLIEMNPS